MDLSIETPQIRQSRVCFERFRCNMKHLLIRNVVQHYELIKYPTKSPNFLRISRTSTPSVSTAHAIKSKWLSAAFTHSNTPLPVQL